MSQHPEPGSTSSSLREQMVGIHTQVPVLDGSLQPYVYLDNAASTPAFRGVQQKVDQFLEWYSSVHRGSGFKSLVATYAYDQARDIVARFVGADPEAHTVVFGKNTTEALNKLAYRLDLQPGDVILTTMMEHHSNDLPWRPKAQVQYAGVLADGSLDIDDYAQHLERSSGRIRLVAVTGASNVTGYMPPIHDMAELAHRHGALFLADCAQLAPHRAVDMGAPGEPRSLDFVALSAHKMYAPFGTGALIGPRAFFAHGEPDQRGGGTIDIVTLDQVHWAAPPNRDEAGSPNVIGAVALAASLRILSAFGMQAIAAHEQALTRHALRRLNGIAGLHVYGSRDPARVEHRVGVIPFAVEGVPHALVAAILAFEGGIGVRSGCFCAQPYLLRLLGIRDHDVAEHRDRVLHGDRIALPGLVRASFGCYNTVEEIDALAAMLERIAGGDFSGRYVVEPATGQYWPLGYDRCTPASYFTL